MATTLLIETFHPFPSLTLTLPSDTPLSEIPTHLPPDLPLRELSLSLPSGVLALDDAPLRSLWDEDMVDAEKVEEDDAEALSARLVRMRLTPRVRGGKGGFGSQLRAAGGRMSSQKTNNNDSCRDLNGRRLSTLKEAKALTAYLDSEPERQKAKQEAQRAKLEKLERKLGIDGKGQGAAAGDEPSSSSKRRFDDTEYLEQSREIVDSVKSAVSAGMLKKRKKTKTSSPPQGEAETSSSAASGSGSKADGTTSSKGGASEEGELGGGTVAEIVQKVLESPATAPVAAVASASLAAIGA